MVAMKQLAPHTTPLLVASWRLIPAGAALLVWAHLSGRKAPTDPTAWLVVALFGLVDGAAFQARPGVAGSWAGAWLAGDGRRWPSACALVQAPLAL